MDNTRLMSESRAALWLSAAALAVFMGGCGLLGWYVGGRPPGWFEGKHLLAPVLVNAVFGLFISVIALGLGAIGLWVAGKVRRRRVGDWLSAGVAGAVFAALLANLTFPWGLVAVHAVATIRQGFWMP
jgi:hypothetical protein